MTRNDLIGLLAALLGHPPRIVEGGAVLVHQPDVGPFAYLCRVYDPAPSGIYQRWFEQYELSATPYRVFLTEVANGLRLTSLSLFGVTGPQVDRSVTAGAGSPISLVYGNIYERPPGLTETDWVIGGVTGWSSRGSYVMDQTGGVRLVHAFDGIDVADAWPSLEAMIRAEATRVAANHDRDGGLLTSWTTVMHPNGRHWETEAEPRDAIH